MNEETTTIGELFDVAAGKTMSKAARDGENQHPFLRTSNVGWGRINVTRVDTMQFSDEDLRTKTLQKGDLLVCEGGEIGKAAIWNDEIENCGFQNHLHRLRPKTEEVVSRFYMYYLQAGFTQLGIYEGAGNKTTIPNLSRSRLEALDVPEPDRLQHARIAAVLWKVQKAVEIEEQLVETAHELKRSAMHQLFKRGLRDVPQKDTEIGPMPETWNPKAIPELCHIWSGGTPRKAVPEFWQGTIPWVSGKDLKTPTLEDAIDHVSDAGVLAGSRLVPADSVLLLVRGMGLAKDLPVAVINKPMAFNQDIKALVPHAGYSGQFVRSAIYAGKERLMSRIVPSAHGTMTLNLNDIEAFQVATPDDPMEAEQIGATLLVIDRKISFHERKRATLQELFKTLLHKLMTGEIRVADLEIDTSEVTQF